MKDVTSETFGLLIAYILPGIVGLMGLAFWSERVRRVLNVFLTDKSSFELFLVALLAALILGMMTTLVRWAIFECWLLKRGFYKGKYFKCDLISPVEFAQLGNKDKLEAFKVISDAHYRYHQLWGGMTVAIPIFFSGWLYYSWSARTLLNTILPTILFLSLELLVLFGARDAYKKFVDRSRNLLTGGTTP